MCHLSPVATRCLLPGAKCNKLIVVDLEPAAKELYICRHATEVKSAFWRIDWVHLICAGKSLLCRDSKCSTAGCEMHFGRLFEYSPGEFSPLGLLLSKRKLV